MTSRERISRVLQHKVPDRVPIVDSPWIATTRRWYKEGLPEDVTAAEHFEYEMEYFGADLTARFPVKVLEKNAEYIVETTAQGGKSKNHRDYSTTPEIIDWPIKTKDDWKEIKKRLQPDFKRIDWASGISKNQAAFEQGKFLCFSCPCGYDALQAYMGTEPLLMTMSDDPEWVKDMVMTLAELIIVTSELMLKNGFRFDGAFLSNDLGYRNGLLFSPEIYKKTHYEADKLLYHYFHSKGMKTILHSCGNVTEIIPVLIEAGLDCLQPLEVKSGMDIIKIKEQYGDKLALMGGIDVRSMAASDPEKIEEEIKQKFQAVKRDGGYIYHSDHSIPNNVSFPRYSAIIELVKKYGAYPEYESIRQQEEAEALQQQAQNASKKQSKKQRGKKAGPAPAEQGTVPQPAAAPGAPEKKARRGFGRKKEPAEKQASPKPEKVQPEKAPKESKKFKLPFGKKK